VTSRQIRIEQRAASYWRATFDHPPINLIDPDTVGELSALISSMETDPQLRVIVFESADPDFFLAHYDVRTTSSQPSTKATPTGLHPWLDVLVRLSRCPVVSIALIRGCARGAGSEFALACDLRFASRERARLGQFEVGVGAVPGGGPMAPLARLAGRGRALEILLSADDFSGELAERYGYVNRALPDAQLDQFVEGFAQRIAHFDKRALAETKHYVDIASLPTNQELADGMTAFFESIRRPETQAQVASLLSAGLQQRSDIELQLGRHVVPRAGATAA
jgi:enoyl-CoA hydratase/carnithine racemase